MAQKSDIIDAEFEVLDAHDFAPDASDTQTPRHAHSKTFNSSNSEHFFKRPVLNKTPMLSEKSASNRIAFYAIGATLVIFTFWWTGGYSLFAPDNKTKSSPIARIEQSHTFQPLDFESTGAIAPVALEPELPNSSSFQAIDVENPNLTTDTSIETLDVAPQIEKTKSSFVFAIGPEKGSHRSLQFKPSY